MPLGGVGRLGGEEVGLLAQPATTRSTATPAAAIPEHLYECVMACVPWRSRP